MKLYADEPGTEVVSAVDHLVVSAMARVEVAAALWRKVSMGELEPGDSAVLGRAFERDWYGGEGRRPRFSPVSVTPALLDAAARLVPVHRLRAYDAVVLASALAVRRVEPEVGFLAWDGELVAAAAREGFALLGAS